MPSNPWRNKRIVIVGASSGLGREIALLLIKKQAKLFLLSRHIATHHFPVPVKRVISIRCDVTDPNSIEAAFRTIDKSTKNIDVIIFCVGIGLERALEHCTTETINEIIQTNLIGAIHVTKAAYVRMIPFRKGHIVLVSSTSGKRGRLLETVYCASKWGLAGFSESLKLEAKTFGIRVTTVYPGGMKTPFYKNYPHKDTSQFMNPASVAQLIVSVIESDERIIPSELVIERV